MKYSRGARNYTSGNKYNVILKFSSVLSFWLFGFLCHKSPVWLKKEVLQCVLQLLVIMILFKDLIPSRLLSLG